MNDGSRLSILLMQFSLMSLLAFGGASSVVPEMYRQTVEIHQWLQAAELSSLFALAQTLPGPNVLVVTLIGWKVAGFVGALVTTLAMCIPCSILSFCAAHAWSRFSHLGRRKVILAGLSALTAGFIAASAYLLATSVDTSLKYTAITVGTMIVTLTFKKLNPLWLIATGAVFGLLLQ